MSATPIPQRDEIMALVVAHFVGLDADPRDTTANAMLHDMAEALHWDALDVDDNVDHALADNDAMLRQVFDEYCSIKSAQEGKSEVAGALIQSYVEAERKAHADLFSLPVAWGV